MIQRLDEVRGNTCKARPGLEACHGLGLAGGFSSRFGFRGGLFALWESGCHGADLIGNRMYR